MKNEKVVLLAVELLNVPTKRIIVWARVVGDFGISAWECWGLFLVTSNTGKRPVPLRMKGCAVGADRQESLHAECQIKFIKN